MTLVDEDVLDRSLAKNGNDHAETRSRGEVLRIFTLQSKTSGRVDYKRVSGRVTVPRRYRR